MEIPPVIDPDPLIDEWECDRAKAGWRGRHRWIAPPPDIRVLLNRVHSDDVLDRVGKLGRDSVQPSVDGRGWAAPASVRSKHPLSRGTAAFKRARGHPPVGRDSFFAPW